MKQHPNVRRQGSPFDMEARPGLHCRCPEPVWAEAAKKPLLPLRPVDREDHGTMAPCLQYFTVPPFLVPGGTGRTGSWRGPRGPLGPVSTACRVKCVPML